MKLTLFTKVKLFLEKLISMIKYFFNSRPFFFLNGAILLSFSFVFSFLNFYWLTIIVIIFISVILFFLITNYVLGLIDEDIKKIHSDISFYVKSYIKVCEDNLKCLESLNSLYLNYSSYFLSRNRLKLLVLSKRFITRSRDFSSLENVNIDSLLLLININNKILNNKLILKTLVSKNKKLRKEITNLSLRFFLKKRRPIVDIYYIFILYIIYGLKQKGIVTFK